MSSRTRMRAARLRSEPGHVIFLATDWKMYEMVVRHEMPPKLIGHRGHPNPPFGEGCRLTWETWGGYD